jgi:hemoglobin/transferrin/lactoferrin receptor protein
MRTLVLLVVSFFLYTSVIAQKIQVLESQSIEPVSGVAIFNSDKSKSGVSDFDGFIDISKFSKNEQITFQHISHIAVSRSKSEIVAASNKVYLELNASSLDEIVLSVAKFGQKKRDIPQEIVSVSEEDILFSNPQTAADLLKGSGQVFIQKSQLGGGSPNIRGFSTNRLLITVDGVRFNNAIFRGGNVQNVISIDPLAIERTEVILGPGSVIYGSDAVGGVMNFYTKRPKFSFEEGVAFSGNALARYATASEEKTGHFDFNIGTKEWAFLTSVSYSDFGDLKMGSNGPDDYLRPFYASTLNGEDILVENTDSRVQVTTGYQQLNTMQKVRYMPSEKWDFNLGLFYTTTSDYPRYDRLIRPKGDGLKSAEWFYGPQEWMSGNIQARNRAYNNGIYDESIITASYQRFKESRNDRDFGDTALFETDEKVTAYTAAWDFQKDFNKAKLNYGLEYVYNKVNSVGKKTDITTGISEADASRYPDGSTWQSLAAYSSVQFKLAEKLSFQGGLRYNHILVDASFEDGFYDFPFSEANIDTGALTGSAGLAWYPNDILSWRLNFGTAFRAPNIDDVGKVFDSEPGSVVVPNPDLKPEFARTGEIGVALNFYDIVKVDVGTYFTSLKDALVRRDYQIDGQSEIIYQGELSKVQAIQNAAKAEVYGFEASIEVNFSKHFQLTSQYSIADGFEQDDGGVSYPLRSAPPMYGNGHFIFKTQRLKLDAFVDYNGQFTFNDLAPSQQNNDFLYAKDENGNPYAPSWHTFNFRTQYSLTDDLVLHATLENITDKRYRPYSSGLSSAGRNFILAASYNF